MRKSIFLSFLSSLFFTAVHAQYNPDHLFKPDLYQYKGDKIRSANGNPGSEYWQNQANYQIDAKFDVHSKELKAVVKIEYINNSPDNLNYLWLQMDQNASAENSKRKQMKMATDQAPFNKGYAIQSVSSNPTKFKNLTFHEYGTRMQIQLPEALKAGETIEFQIAYSYKLQPEGPDFRSGYMNSDNGEIYQFAYWYPRMAVYDDYYGWNTLPFLGGGEMYLDYGTIDYKLTVPSDQVVAGAGVLVNEQEILTEKILQRLKEAQASDKTVMIRKPNEIKEPVTRTKSDYTTWHFKMENTRDVAWAMSKAYVWDAAKINLNNGKTALSQSFYPIESTQANRAWARSTEMIKGSVEFFSKYLMDYPYKVASSVAGTVGGMEFPGLAFNHWDVEPYMMFLLASHEIGHTWFPMIVGSDERRNPFMDEGFNVFIDVLAQEQFNDGEFAPKRDGEYAPGGGNPNDEIIEVMKEAQGKGTIMTAADDMEYKYVHPLAYFKAAHGLVLLRDVVLGHEKFDFAFQQYFKNWAYKHPRPEDFFRSMDNATGEDLTWFWNGWFYNNYQLDQEIAKVEYAENNPEKGGLITLKNNDQMAMPVLLKVEESNGKIHEMTIPVEIWKFGSTTQIKVETTSKIKKVILDENHQLPDTNRANNEWQG